jgi:hypothetical protein
VPQSTKGSPADSPLFASFCDLGTGQLALAVSGVTATIFASLYPA